MQSRLSVTQIVANLATRLLHVNVLVQGHLLGIQGPFLEPIAQVAIDLSEGCDPAVKSNAARILKELQLEEERFSTTLVTGERLLTDIMQVAV